MEAKPSEALLGLSSFVVALTSEQAVTIRTNVTICRPS